MDEFNKDLNSDINKEEFDKDLNSDIDMDNTNTEDNKAFDFDLSILDRVKPPQVEVEKETNPIDEIHPMDINEHIDFPTEKEETTPFEPHVEFEEEKEEIDEPKEEVQEEYNENPFINNNPYEESIENTNPYVDYDNMEDVIGTTNIEEPKEEEPVEEEPEEVEEDNTIKETPSYTSNIDKDFKELEKEQKKNEKAEKADNMKFIFLFIMFVIVAALIAYFHFNGDKGEPKTIPPVDIKTGDDDKDKDKDKEPPVVEGDFNKKIETELDSYYSDGDTTALSSLLSSSYNDAEKIEDIHNTTNTKVESWIDSLVSKDSKDYEAFTKEVNNVRSKLDSLHNIKYSDVSYIEDDKYQEYSTKLNKIDEDSNDYYVALELYSKNDYNKAYQAFEAIPTTSAFYEASQKHMKDIVTNIMDILNADVKRISLNLDYVNEEEQQVKYKQIKSIIERYAIAYPYVKLTNNEEYNNLLKKYTDLIK